MTESATLVVTAQPNPDEMTSVQAYLQGVMPLLTTAGGTLVKRLRVDEVINGTPAGMAMIMDFESAAEITALFASPDYQELLPDRDRGFHEMNILITRQM